MSSRELDSTLPSSRQLGGASTSSGLVPADAPALLADAEHERRRRALEAALFGDEGAEVSFGRYHLLHRLGHGAMGVVHAAYDARLDRKLALKRIHTRRQGSEELRERTVREAQALARLAHPNVVYVFEVGEVDGELFVAMEFLAGPTLRAWLDARPQRPWREVLAVLRQAGEGLAAAHARGVVHRDFKPHNAMFGADGRLRVLDFGLARFAELHEAARSRIMTHADATAPELTGTGAVLGTPAYMAPEQFLGHVVDARSDQFSFCVAAFEALYGARPFAGEGFAALASAVTGGRIAARPRDTRVPAWVHAALLRGLATDPARRWPSMRALLVALERDPGARRRRIVLAGVGVLALAAAGVAYASHRHADLRARIAGCEASGAAIDAVWPRGDADASQQRATTAGAIDDRVARTLDARAAAWQRAATQACLSAEVDGTVDPALRERAAWCLDDRRLELAALVAGLGERNVAVDLDGARDVDECIDEAWLQRHPTPPVRAREGLDAAREGLARADGLLRLGEPRAALAAATAARLRATGWPPLRATARLREATALTRLGAPHQAEAALRDAYFTAAHAGAWDLAADAATDLIAVIGGALEQRPGRRDEALAWDLHAGLAIAHTPDPHRWREARRLHRLADLRLALGEHAAARSLYERAIEVVAARPGVDDRWLAALVDGLARAHRAAGDEVQALAAERRARALREAPP